MLRLDDHMSSRVEPEPPNPTRDTLVASSDAVAVVVAAVEEWLGSDAAFRRDRVAGGKSATSPWRFSGRNWAGPVSLRRDRPRR